MALASYVNSEVKVTSSIPTLVNKSSHGEKASSDEEKAEMFNKFFTSVFTRERLDNIPEFSDHDFVTSLAK